MDRTLPCPNCGTDIPFQVDVLLAGTEFGCPGCESRIGLTSEGHQVASAARESYEVAKAQLDVAGTEGAAPNGVAPQIKVKQVTGRRAAALAAQERRSRRKRKD